MNKLKLINKTKLTHDVYELIFESDYEIPTKAGQFITFMLPSGLRRAYSISDLKGNSFYFIIKRIENGKGGSKEICDMEIGTFLDFIGPVGHFILNGLSESKLFIGTGTGFAPLYFQLVASLKSGDLSQMRLVFGVRNKIDLFYEDALKKLKSNYPNFDYTLFLSRENSFDYRKGYVTDYLSRENISIFDSFYICGSPQMIGEARGKLESFKVPKDKIFFEQY